MMLEHDLKSHGLSIDEVKKKTLKLRINEFENSKFFKKSKIAITGSNGFISTHLKYLLYSIGFKSIILINSNNTDYSTKSLVKISKADYVIHLSSATGGIKYTKKI